MLGEGIEQLCIFAVFFVLGTVFSAIYIFFVGLTKPKLAAIIFDCIFGALALYVTWKVNLQVNNGECRAFLFVALLAGVTFTYVTCKRTLDKLSSMLYNLFTKLFERDSVDDDGKTVLQKVNSSDIRSGDTDTGIASLHATGNADANVVTKRARRKASSAHRRRKRTRSTNPRTAGVHAIERVRKRVGRKS